MSMKIDAVLSSALQDHEAGWSMGSFGALAEFHQDDGETTLVDAPDALTRATARGAIRIDREALSECHPVAYEQLSKKRERWGQGLALCLPEDDASMAQRSAVTSLGPDNDAIREEDRGAQLFDMGLGLKQCDFLIRTRDEVLIDTLNANAGRSIFEHGNPSMGAILKTHPHRIALTPLGRVEVFQKIGGPDTGGVSPPGPHTHVLPKLMAAGKTHAANITVPHGLIPCAYLHPGNPLTDGLGHSRPYNAALADGFAEHYNAYAPNELRDIKKSVAEAVAAGQDAAGLETPGTRHGRITVRVTLRQLTQKAALQNDEALLSSIERWQRKFDSSAAPVDEEPDEQAEHGRQHAISQE
ncbi:MAG: hypothetical protein AAGI06_06550 [Pseudomonadota bacterium]